MFFKILTHLQPAGDAPVMRLTKDYCTPYWNEFKERLGDAFFSSPRQLSGLCT